MRERTDPVWATAGRAAALAAFDRGDDGAVLAEQVAETGPAAEDSRRADGDVVTTLRFAHEGLALDLHVRSHGDHRSVSGLVTGAFDHATLHVRRPGTIHRLRIGLDGRFTVADLARGPLSLALRRPGRTAVVTRWFTV